MKGIILAGGHGTRMGDCTKVTNKHLLAVYDKPMILYPLQTLLDAGLEDILIISGSAHCGSFMNLLGSGKEYSARFMYAVQDKASGIAQALSLARPFAGNDSVAVILGDNYFEASIKEDIKSFKSGAKIFLKKVDDPTRFGVAETDGKIIKRIREKPKNPASNLAVTGLYLYDNKVFDYICTLKPSVRNEFEITDVNNIYIAKRSMEFKVLNGFWSDMGTPDSLYRTAGFLKRKQEKK